MEEITSPPRRWRPVKSMLPTSPIARTWTRFLPSFGLYARISSNFGWDAFTARSVPASSCARRSAGSSLVCPSYADAFNLFVFNQLTSSFSMKSSAGWFTRNDARRLPGSPVKSQVSVVPAAGFSVFSYGRSPCADAQNMSPIL